ncbi:Ras family [Aciduliprofundum sp. MAR08-339]|uniref:Rab family GTPase n=1 Tax=Aciduliprofundum sp. (strain MAR08-339) TaxID=673860 RepID=UPI0002A4BCC8|nr:Ras family [Aciduliprofundum sp. MAR08-339]
MRAPKIWKVCVLGDKSVGKTSLIRRFVYDAFESEIDETLQSKTCRRKVGEVTLLIWDVSVYEQNIKPILSGAKAIIIVGDLTRRETLETMGQIAEFLDGHKAQKIFVANKNDLKYRAEFWKDELEDISDAFGYPYFLTSAKTGENVETVFSSIVEGTL